MNERIRELLLQATTLRGPPFIRFKVDQEKFAKLIVQECTEIALEQKKWVEDQKVHNPEDEVWNRARIQQSQHIMNKIEQHFGVER
jgi:hypothetical protein